MSRLSAEQRARLAMLLLRLTEPHLYLLDEPTNHLDIEGQDLLENELNEHETTCLLVSHDRAFITNFATQFWVIENKKLIEVDDPAPVFAKLIAE